MTASLLPDDSEGTIVLLAIGAADVKESRTLTRSYERREPTYSLFSPADSFAADSIYSADRADSIDVGYSPDRLFFQLSLIMRISFIAR